MQSLNELVVWDRVVTSPGDGRLLEQDAWFKYPVVDQRTEMRGRLLNLTLHWDVMPYSGLLYAGRGGSFTARLPPAYCVEGQHAGAAGAAVCSFETVGAAGAGASS